MARRADVDALIAGFERCASTAPLFAEDSSSDERASARRLEDARDDARDRSASDSDWSDAELRESDGAAFDEKPPSAAQGGGRPWAHAARARRRARRAARAEAKANDASAEEGDEMMVGSGVFIGDLHADATLEILRHLTPRDVARVAATRKKERNMLVGKTSEIAEAAWGRVKLRKGESASKALATLRCVAKDTLKELDVSSVRGMRKAELLATMEACEALREFRAVDMGEMGKLTTKDVRAYARAIGTRLRKITCDLGHKILYDPIRRDPTAKYVDVYDDNVQDLVETLAIPQLHVRRLKLHSSDPGSVRAAAVAAASNGPNKVESFDASWSLRISNEGARAVAEVLAQGWDLKRLALRKVNVSDDGAVSLAEAIKASAESGTSKLRWLDLGSNDVRSRGAVAIGEALEHPGVNITRLTLRGNGICSEGMDALGKGISMSSTLRRIDLAHNGFGDRGSIAFASPHSPASPWIARRGTPGTRAAVPGSPTPSNASSTARRAARRARTPSRARATTTTRASASRAMGTRARASRRPRATTRARSRASASGRACCWITFNTSSDSTRGSRCRTCGSDANTRG